MNTLIVGRDKSPVLSTLPDTFLLIDDGELIDQVEHIPHRKIIEFDIAKHSYNPLAKMNYVRAREIISILNAVFPEGENTLTKAAFNYQLLEALSAKPRRLAKLIPDTKDTQYAYQKIQTLLLSPVLYDVLCRPPHFKFDIRYPIVVRLDRAKLGDFDCFVLGNLLIQQYNGQIVIPDFGFYSSPHHTSLIRQGRLIAGINSLDEVPLKMRQQLLLIKDKAAKHCTAADAEILAQYAGLAPATNAYADFIQKCID